MNRSYRSAGALFQLIRVARSCPLWQVVLRKARAVSLRSYMTAVLVVSFHSIDKLVNRSNFGDELKVLRRC